MWRSHPRRCGRRAAQLQYTRVECQWFSPPLSARGRRERRGEQATSASDAAVVPRPPALARHSGPRKASDGSGRVLRPAQARAEENVTESGELSRVIRPSGPAPLEDGAQDPAVWCRRHSFR